jgi:hypothetical protein
MEYFSRGLYCLIMGSGIIEAVFKAREYFKSKREDKGEFAEFLARRICEMLITTILHFY